MHSYSHIASGVAPITRSQKPAIGISCDLLAASAAKLWGWGRNTWKIFETLASFPTSLPCSFYLRPTCPSSRAGCLPPIYPSSRPVTVFLAFPVMQRALTSRTSVLSSAAKRAPFARSPLNLQQQRFAHKVRDKASAIAARMDQSMACGIVFRWIRSVPIANRCCL